MFDDLKDEKYLGLDNKRVLSISTSRGEFQLTQLELKIAYDAYIENINKEFFQKIEAIKIAFKNFGIEKSDTEAEQLLEVASMTRLPLVAEAARTMQICR